MNAAQSSSNCGPASSLAAAGLKGSDFIKGWKRREEPLDIGFVDESSMLDARQLEDLNEIFPTLSSLDISYRVITLLVLGVLLIASALAWTRLKPVPDQRADAEAQVSVTGGLKQAPTSPPRHGQMPLR